MLYDVLELLLNYMQYLYLTVTIAPSVFPTLYSSPFRLLDDMMSVVTYTSRGGSGNPGEGSGTGKDGETANDIGEQLRTLGVYLPSWIPLDLRMLFFITNILCPTALVFITALLLGPPHFTGFVYLLCTSLFFMVAGALLLDMHASHNLPDGAKTLSRLLHAVSVREAIIITAVGTSAVLLLVVLGVVLQVMWSACRRVQVLERLGDLEHAPRTVEERVTEGLLHPSVLSSSGGEGEEDEWDQERLMWVVEAAATAEEEKENVRMQRVKAELAYRRMLWRKHKETRATSLPWAFLKVAMVLACLSAAFLFARVPKSKALEPIQSSPLFFPLAAFLFLLVPILVASLMLGLTRGGRRRLFGIKLWLRHMFLWIVLLVVSFMYAPILRNAINLFPCRSVDEAVVTNSSSSDGSMCNVLSFVRASSVWGAGLGGFSLVADSRVPCDGVDSFISISAILTVATYAVFFLLLYSLVTRQVLQSLDQYPLGNLAVKSTCASGGRWRRGDSSGGRKKNLTLYYERVRSSKNEAQFLYAPYAYAFRYFRVVVLAQKTAMVIISTVMREGGGMVNPWIGFATSFILHAGVAVVLVFCQPYAEPLEFVVSLALQVMLSLLAVMGLASALVNTAVPVVFWFFLTPSLFLVPFGAVVMGAILTIRRQSRRRRAAKAGSRNELRSSCTGWLMVLARHLGRRGTDRNPGRWYEQHASKDVRNQIFIPALYFTDADEKVVSLSSSLSATSAAVVEASAAERSDVVGDAEAASCSIRCSPITSSFPAAAKHVAISLPFPKNGRQRVNEPYGSEGGNKASVRARQCWTVLRSAVFSGWLGQCVHDPLGASYAFAPWRTAPAAPPPSHSLAMQTLLVTVASKSRWEMSPNVRVNDRGAGELKQGRDQGNGSDIMSSPHVVTPPKQVRREEVFLERVHAFAALQRLLSLYGHHKRHILRQQRAVDCYINAQASQTVRQLLLFLGVVSVVEAALCVCGFLLVENI